MFKVSINKKEKEEKEEIEVPKPESRKKRSIREEIEDLKAVFNQPEKLKEMVDKSKQYRKFLKKQKKFKLPKKVLSQAKKAYKSNKIVIILLRRDRNVEFLVTQMINGMIYLDGTPHSCSTDFVFLIKGKIPCLIVPQWSLDPIGTEDYYKAVKAQKTTEAATIILRAIEAKENMMLQKKMSPKMLIWVLVGAVALFAIFFLQRK